MALSELKDFYLVGGTALALKFGHRISVDLDLFGNQGFEKGIIIESLKNEFGKDFVFEGNPSKWGLFCFIQDVKVDIIQYPHSVIKQPELVDFIRMYSTEDIVAMKLNAILGRGMKKDFWDIYELLRHYSLEEMIDFHSKKFPSQQLLISIPQALTYFADAEESEAPISLKGQTWEEVKKGIQASVREFLN